MTPEDMEKAFEVAKRPEFWCRAKLFQALAAAGEKGVLNEVLDEMDVPDDVQRSIVHHLNEHWKP